MLDNHKTLCQVETKDNRKEMDMKDIKEGLFDEDGQTFYFREENGKKQIYKVVVSSKENNVRKDISEQEDLFDIETDIEELTMQLDYIKRITESKDNYYEA
jgi:hypothetical protein